ncbi:MAG: hypothetical protein AAB445_03245 [Patescibacteria group bacterium]
MNLLYVTQDELLAQHISNTATLYDWEGFKRFLTPKEALRRTYVEAPEIIFVDCQGENQYDVLMDFVRTYPGSDVVSLASPTEARNDAFYAEVKEMITQFLQPPTGGTIH